MTTSIADIKRVFIDTSAWIDLMNDDAIFGFDHHMSLAGIPVLPGLLDRSSL